MTTITTRSGKGSPLTNNEVDANFTNLNDDKVEASGDSMTGNLSFGDNNKAIFGAGSDLQIYHDGLNSVIRDSGTGELQIRGTDLKLQDADGNNYISLIDGGTGGTVYLKHNGADKLETTSTGIEVTGTAVADSYDIGTLGTLGSVATDRLFIATADGLGLQFDFDNSRIVPVGADGSTYNNNVSLGSSGLEFKNLLLSGNATVGGTVTTNGISSNGDVTITSTDTGTSYGPNLTLRRDSASPADNDFIGRILWQGDNSAGENTSYAALHTRLSDVTDGTEDGLVQLDVMVGGTATNLLDVGASGIVMNDGSADVDFRVESNNQTHAIFVDAGNDTVNINRSSGPAALNVQSDSGADGIAVYGRSSDNISQFTMYNSGGTGLSQLQTRPQYLDIRSLADIPVIISPNASGKFYVYSGETVVNENSADHDFRVESNNQSHMLFVDGNEDRVGIGTSAPSERLTIKANGNADILGIEMSGNLVNLVSLNQYNDHGAIFVRQNNGVVQHSITATGGVVFNEGSLDQDFRIETNGGENTFFVDGGTNNIGLGTATTYAHQQGTAIDMVYSSTIWAGGTYWAGGLKLGESFYVTTSGEKYKHSSRQATMGYYNSQGGSIHFYSAPGGTADDVITWQELAEFDRSEVVFNNGSADQDFRVESNNNANMLFVNAGTDKVGIGVSDPQAELFVRKDTAGPARLGISNAGTVGSTTSARLAFYEGNTETSYIERRRDGSGDTAIVTPAADNPVNIEVNGGNELASFKGSEIIFNEDSGDQDFRVESDAYTHALFVDAGNDKLGVQTSSPVKPISLGSRTGNNLSYIFGTSQTINENSGIFVSGNSADTTDMDYGLHLANNNNADGAYSPVIGFSALSESNGYNHTYAYIAGYRRDNGADTNWNTGGIEFMTSSGTGPYTRLNIDYLGGLITTPTTGGDAVFNESSADADFRVESNSQANGIVLDGNLNSLSFGNTVKNLASNYGDQHGVGIDLLTGKTEISGDETPLEIGRTSTAGANGAFIQFRSASTPIGIIRNIDSDLVVHTSTSAHTGLRFGAGYIAPTNNSGAVTDDAVDLGLNTARFNTIKLSDGVQFGNSGATAELLDDYEEGTFTPTLSGGFSSAPTSYNTREGRYTKIGRYVYFEIDIFPQGATADSSSINIDDLPFTATASSPFGGAVITYQTGFNTNAGDTLHIGGNDDDILIADTSGNGRAGNASGVNINQRIIISGWYTAA